MARRRTDVPEPAASRRLVAVRLVPVAGREARAHGDVGVSLPNDLEKARQLVHGMLAVGVDPADVRVRIRLRVGVAGGDPLLQPTVLSEREHFGSVRARHGGRPVRRAVVDDEDVGLRQPGAQLVEHGREIRLLVPGGDEDERVGTRHADERRRCPSVRDHPSIEWAARGMAALKSVPTMRLWMHAALRSRLTERASTGASHESGQIMVITALSMVMFIVCVGLVVDVGHAMLVQRQLQAGSTPPRSLRPTSFPTKPMR